MFCPATADWCICGRSPLRWTELVCHCRPCPGLLTLTPAQWAALAGIGGLMAGNLLAQYDGQPQEGDYPTSRWTPGELIEDSYPILLPADAPVGPYRVYLGLYDEATLARLPVATDPEGRVILNVE